jgi:hypothetical protein
VPGDFVHAKAGGFAKLSQARFFTIVPSLQALSSFSTVLCAKSRKSWYAFEETSLRESWPNQSLQLSPELASGDPSAPSSEIIYCQLTSGIFSPLSDMNFLHHHLGRTLHGTGDLAYIVDALHIEAD